MAGAAASDSPPKHAGRHRLLQRTVGWAGSGARRLCAGQPGAPRGADPLEVVRRQAAEAPGDRLSSPTATKIHASARGSRSAGIAPAAWQRVSDRRRRSRARRAGGGAGSAGSPGRRPDSVSACSQSCATAERCSLNSKNAFDIACVQARRVGLGRDRLVPRGADPLPGALDAGEVERLLRGEVAVEDRLGHARLAGDLGGGRAAVRAAGEDAAGGVEHGGAPLLGREPRPRAHPASASATGSLGLAARPPARASRRRPARRASSARPRSRARGGTRR